LRVLASRERQRVAGDTSGISAFSPAFFPTAWLDRLRMSSRDLMRPLALPFAGGLFSTILAFSMWLSTGVQASGGFDIATSLSARSQVKSLVTRDPSVLQTAPVQAFGADDVVVDVMVNGQGGMVGYTIVSGNVTQDEALERSIASVLLLTKFNPATTLGKPVEGTIRLSLSALHSKIDVKG
jgi:hypothetical protein